VGKQKMIPGGEINALTPEEAKALLENIFNREVRERVRAQATLKTDATGAATINVYTVDPGMEFRLSRVVIEADGFSFAVPFTNAAGSATIQREGQIQGGFNLAAGLPNTYTAGSADSPRYRNGEKVSVVLVGGPAATNVNVRIEGDLYPYRAPGSK
jgi:hypothetical protein